MKSQKPTTVHNNVSYIEGDIVLLRGEVIIRCDAPLVKQKSPKAAAVSAKVPNTNDKQGD